MGGEQIPTLNAPFKALKISVCGARMCLHAWLEKKGDDSRFTFGLQEQHVSMAVSVCLVGVCVASSITVTWTLWPASRLHLDFNGVIIPCSCILSKAISCCIWNQLLCMFEISPFLGFIRAEIGFTSALERICQKMTHAWQGCYFCVCFCRIWNSKRQNQRNQ